jgi:hypothetical protein
VGELRTASLAFGTEQTLPDIKGSLYRVTPIV